MWVSPSERGLREPESSSFACTQILYKYRYASSAPFSKILCVAFRSICVYNCNLRKKENKNRTFTFEIFQTKKERRRQNNKQRQQQPKTRKKTRTTTTRQRASIGSTYAEAKRAQLCAYKAEIVDGSANLRSFYEFLATCRRFRGVRELYKDINKRRRARTALPTPSTPFLLPRTRVRVRAWVSVSAWRVAPNTRKKWSDREREGQRAKTQWQDALGVWVLCRLLCAHAAFTSTHRTVCECVGKQQENNPKRREKKRTKFKARKKEERARSEKNPRYFVWLCASHLYLLVCMWIHFLYTAVPTPLQRRRGQAAAERKRKNTTSWSSLSSRTRGRTSKRNYWTEEAHEK